MLEKIKKDIGILIVDDSNTIQVQMEQYLGAMGFTKLYFANDGMHAVQMMEKCHKNEQPIDLVFSDINMPGMNGIDFLQVVRTKYPKLPVIMISAESSTKTVIKALDRGANQYILKPITEKKLAEKMIKTLT